MLGEVLDVMLRLLHPVVPFVTESLWTTLTGGESVVVAPTGRSTPGFRDADAEREIATLQQAVTEVRRFRADQGLQPGQRVPARLALEGTQLARPRGRDPAAPAASAGGRELPRHRVASRRGSDG